MPRLVGLSEECSIPIKGDIESPDLSKTIRVHQHENDTGGFFVALFEHVAERTPEGIARSMILHRELNREPEELPRRKRSKHTTIPAQKTWSMRSVRNGELTRMNLLGGREERE